MLFPIVPQKSPELNKEASILGLAASTIAGEAAMEGLKHFGAKRGANFLSAGIELGRKGEKMNPYAEGLSRNILGNKQLGPYNAGQEIGKRMSQMDDNQSERFLGKVIGMGAARKNRLLEESRKKKLKDPILNAIDDYQIGTDRKRKLFQSAIESKSIPENETKPLLGVAADLTTLPASYVDFRAAARPVMRRAENHPVGQKVQKKLFPENTKKEKVYHWLRHYVD